MGVTPKLVGGAWVGGEYRQIHFRSGALGQGSRTALPIFGLFMRKVLSDPSLSPKYLAKYPIPEGVNPADIAKRDEPVQRASEEADSTDFTDLDAPYQELENQANQADRGENYSGEGTHSPSQPAQPANNTPSQPQQPANGTPRKETQNNSQSASPSPRLKRTATTSSIDSNDFAYTFPISRDREMGFFFSSHRTTHTTAASCANSRRQADDSFRPRTKTSRFSPKSSPLLEKNALLFLERRRKKGAPCNFLLLHPHI